MRGCTKFTLWLLSLATVTAAPVGEKTTTPPPTESTTAGADTLEELEYKRYVREVVKLLESDPVFKEKLEKASEDDIKTGKIADELDFAHHEVRTKLDEAKRMEIQRLREAIMEQGERENGYHNGKDPDHIDHGGNTFEKEDLKKLILQVHKDLDEIDRKRREEFKRYEMEKELEYRESLENMTETDRKKAEEEHKQQLEKHNKHEKVHHPGGKEQLQEVWEEVDKMPKEAFNMRTLFRLHDLNNDGFLDAEESEALVQHELDKMYDKNVTEDDLVEREEDQARMREHIMTEMDANRDGLVSEAEFLNEEKDPNFEKDEEWDSVGDGKPEFKSEELEVYSAERRKRKGLPEPVLNNTGQPVANAAHANSTDKLSNQQPLANQVPQYAQGGYQQQLPPNPVYPQQQLPNQYPNPQQQMGQNNPNLQQPMQPVFNPNNQFVQDTQVPNQQPQQQY